MVRKDEHVARLGLTSEGGHCSCGIGAQREPRPWGQKRRKDNGAEARCEQLEHKDVQPFDVLRSKSNVPEETVHETTQAWGTCGTRLRR